MKKISILMLALFSLGCVAVIEHQISTKKDSVPQMEVIPSENGISQLKCIFGESDCYISLCQDGSVWTWDSVDDVNQVNKMQNLEKVSKIVDAGSAFYALTEEGGVYAWGSNEDLLIDWNGERTDIYDEAVRLSEICDIVELDAKNGKGFAVDKDGNFYMWGLYVNGYENELEDNRPSIPHNASSYVSNVKRIFAGAGNYHYFVREDGSVFSIMESDNFEIDVYDFIFPMAVSKEQDSDTVSLQDISYIDLREGTKYGFTILYELEDIKDVELIGADEYTVFLYGKDKSLMYWDSDAITYHDNKNAMARPETGCENYNGEFKQVDVKSIVGKREELPNVIDICSGKENVFFLTDSGNVFFSEYVTREIKDVDYYDLSGTNPNREMIQTIQNMHLKTISLKNTELKNIVEIETDGEYILYAVDNRGEYFVIDMR